MKVYREEIKALYDLGCRRIQFDDPGFAFFCSEDMIKGMQALGEDYEGLVDTLIGVYNAITADWAADLVFAVHTCRGNMKVGGRERRRITWLWLTSWTTSGPAFLRRRVRACRQETVQDAECGRVLRECGSIEDCPAQALMHPLCHSWSTTASGRVD